MKEKEILFEKLERIKNHKKSLILMILELEEKIKQKKSEVQMINDSFINYQIKYTTEKRNFFQNYTFFPKGYFKSFFKNIFLFGILSLVLFVSINIFLFLSYLPKTFLTSGYYVTLILISSLLSFYTIFINPIVNNYKKMQKIEEEYEDVESFNLKLQELEIELEQNRKLRNNAKNELKMAELKCAKLQDILEYVNQSESQIMQQIDNEFNSIWNEIVNERYIYDIDLSEPLILNLKFNNNKKNRF